MKFQFYGILLFNLLLCSLLQGQTSSPEPTPPFCPECTVTYAGQILDTRGKPVPGSYVESLDGTKSPADEEGFFSLSLRGIDSQCSGIMGDTYLFARAPGYEDSSRFLSVACGRQTMTFVLAYSPVGLVTAVGDKSEVPVKDPLTLSFFVNTGTQTIASYSITLNYDSGAMELDYKNFPSAIEPGAEGFFTAAGMESPGVVVITGFDPGGKGPGSRLELVRVHFLTKRVQAAHITFSVDTLIDSSNKDIGVPRGGEVEINIVSGYKRGDVNRDRVVNIVDALMVAQYSVGLPVVGFYAQSGDMNYDLIVNIVDALLIARMVVGFPV